MPRETKVANLVRCRAGLGAACSAKNRSHDFHHSKIWSLTVRTELEQASGRGFPGAAAIHEALKVRKIDLLPSVRTKGWQTSRDWVAVESEYPNMNGNPGVVKG